MIDTIGAIVAALAVFFRSRLDLSFEVLALRQQLVVLKRKRRRPVLSRLDRLFWILLRSVWPRWSDVLAIVKPATEIAWHRRGFRLYWRWRSRRRSGRPRITDEVRSLIRQMSLENAGWGAPKIHGELLKLGLAVSERTVTRYLRGLRPRTGRSDQRWKAFLANHREAIVAFDLFTVPTLTFNLLYCFVIIEHRRRKILHCNMTSHPTSKWVVQQLREAFPEAAPYRYAIFDHDSKFNVDVVRLLAGTGVEPKRTSIEAPWQNGVAERWIGSCHREMPDRVIPLNEHHLRRLLRDYASYHNDDRVHDALNKDAPNGRPVDERPSPAARVISQPRLGGLHHRYAWKVAA
ncbi:MAG TPA: integrase core domain-containing protein [Bryobacteraceae bacterium]|nr:integrase core domain-containing protein [Bryobacteraceae bacterium]